MINLNVDEIIEIWEEKYCKGKCSKYGTGVCRRSLDHKLKCMLIHYLARELGIDKD